MEGGRMKTKIIFWGWMISWLLMMAGIGTLCDASEKGNASQWIIGFVLIGVWFVFSMLINDHKDECLTYLNELEKKIDNLLS